MLPFEKNEDVVAVKVLKGKFIGYTLALRLMYFGCLSDSHTFYM